MKHSVLLLGLCSCLCAAPASAACLSSERLTGVNIAGAEFGKVPGRLNFDYIYPARKELEQLRALGGNTIRLPIRWERIRPTVDGSLSASELEQIVATAKVAAELDVCLIIDLHNYARYYGEALKENARLKTAFSDTWLQLAATLPDTAHVAFGLMNEPVHMPVHEWAQLAQSTVTQLRQHEHGHLLMVAGGRWSGAHDWFSGSSPDINAEAFANFVDPADNYAIEVHQYADSNYSGTHDTCRDAKHFEAIFKRVSDWAVREDVRIFLGEFGVAGNALCLETLKAFMDMTASSPWLGWTYWAAGSWWGDYPMAVSLTDTDASPRWSILRAHFGRGEPQ